MDAIGTICFSLKRPYFQIFPAAVNRGIARARAFPILPTTFCMRQKDEYLAVLCA